MISLVIQGLSEADQGVWIIELAELDSMSRGEVSRVKAFMSRQVDNIRPPCGRRPIKTPRECVFAGSTDQPDYLRDETGGRRWWPVQCGQINIDDLRRDRDQLWAEAVVRYRAGATWWLDSEELVKAAAVEQQDRYEGDAWDEKIAEFIASRDTVSVPNILELCIEKPEKDWSRADDMRISRSLKSQGWDPLSRSSR
jgi:putative DNA primase/helicase